MHIEAVLRSLVIMSMSFVFQVHRTDSAACHTPVEFVHYTVHHNGDFEELCKMDVRQCKGGCNAYYKHRIQQLPTPNAAITHCEYAVDCCKVDQTEYVTKTLYDCKPTGSAPPGSISQGPFILTNVEQPTSTGCKCADNSLVGSDALKCKEMHL